MVVLVNELNPEYIVDTDAVAGPTITSNVATSPLLSVAVLIKVLVLVFVPEYMVVAKVNGVEVDRAEIVEFGKKELAETGGNEERELNGMILWLLTTLVEIDRPLAVRIDEERAKEAN